MSSQEREAAKRILNGSHVYADTCVVAGAYLALEEINRQHVAQIQSNGETIAVLQGQVRELEQERDRYKAALEEITNLDRGIYQHIIKPATSIARAALAQQEKPNESNRIS